MSGVNRQDRHADGSDTAALGMALAAHIRSYRSLTCRSPLADAPQTAGTRRRTSLFAALAAAVGVLVLVFTWPTQLPTGRTPLAGDRAEMPLTLRPGALETTGAMLPVQPAVPHAERVTRVRFRLPPRPSLREG